MADDNKMITRMRDRQVRLGCMLEREKITFKAISYASGIPYSTIRSYFSQEKNAVIAAMPVHALVQLFGVIPDYLLSTLTEPEGRCFHGTTPAERAAEDRLLAIRAEVDKALAAMRGDIGQDELFDGGGV